MRPIDADAAVAAVHDKYAEYFNMFHGARERAILHDFKNSVLVALDNIPAISRNEVSKVE